MMAIYILFSLEALLKCVTVENIILLDFTILPFGLMAFIVIGSVVSDSIIKGIISTLFGAVVGLIGEDIITGQFKMTMGIDELESGMAEKINLAPAGLLLFAISIINLY